MVSDPASNLCPAKTWVINYLSILNIIRPLSNIWKCRLLLSSQNGFFFWYASWFHFPECPPTPQARLLTFFFLVKSLALVNPPLHVRVPQESAFSQLMVSIWYCLPLNMLKDQTQHPLSSHIPISISYHHIFSFSRQKCTSGDGKKFWVSGNGCITLWIW